MALLRFAARRGLVVLGLFVFWGCDETPKPSPSPPAQPSSSPARTPPPKPTRPPAQCRVLSVKGKAMHMGRPLATGNVVSGMGWVELDKDSQLSLRHTRTSREWSLEGPGRFWPCVGSDEHLVLSEGKVRTAAGGGARPGVEVIVASPHGYVRYGNASLLVEVNASRTVVSAQSGDGWAETTPQSKRAGPEHVIAPKGKATLSGTSSPTATTESCERAAQDSSRAANLVLTPDADGGLGERTAAHVKARSLARGLCLAALAAASSESDPAVRERLESRVQRAQKVYQAVPRRRGLRGQ